MLIVLELEVQVPGSEVSTRVGNPVPLSEEQTQQVATTGNKENGNVNNSAKREPAPAPIVKAEAAAPSMPSNMARQPANAGQQAPLMGELPPKRARMDTGLSEANIRPINSINPYQNKWVIKARVTAKPAIRTWSNQRGEGKLFSMDLKDHSGEIRATAFNEEASFCH